MKTQQPASLAVADDIDAMEESDGWGEEDDEDIDAEGIDFFILIILKKKKRDIEKYHT